MPRYLTNFEQLLGERELEKNLIDLLSVSGEVPLPTEQALQEISEIVVRGGKQSFSEGRLLILANTRGYPLVETEYLSQFGKDQPFAWDKIPYALAVGKEDYTMPKQVQVGAGKVTLHPLGSSDEIAQASGAFLPPRQMRHQRGLFR